MQTTDTVLLIKPASFAYNIETATSNAFQNNLQQKPQVIMQKVLQEFNQFAQALTDNGINVIIENDTETPIKPDAIFPNNWISFHRDGNIVLYPMAAKNRQQERRADIVDRVKKQFNFKQIIDLSIAENEQQYLEGTGSIVFDHQNKIAYACLSPRTHQELFVDFCQTIGYKPLYFLAHDKQGKEIYHTNVMMCIAEKFAVICTESITDLAERKQVIDSLLSTGHQVIPITIAQMNCFAGNMLALHSAQHPAILVLSATAYKSLTTEQINTLQSYATLLPMPIETIETIGGGSARCMIAEVFYPEVPNN
jgi:hypothetical protein